MESWAAKWLTVAVAAGLACSALGQPDMDMAGMEDMMAQMGGKGKGGKGGMDMMDMMGKGGKGGKGGMDMMDMMGKGGGPPKATARKADVKYIACEVCQEAVKQLYRQSEAKKNSMKKKRALSEEAVEEISESICDPNLPEGKWLKETRLKAKDDALILVPDWEKETCGEDCATIARACSETYGDASLDLAESVYNGAKRAKLQIQACNELSSACVGKPPKLPKAHPKRKSKGKKKSAASKEEL